MSMIGSDADMDVLKEFTGSKHSVVEVWNKAEIEKCIRCFSVIVCQYGPAGREQSLFDRVVDEFCAELADDPDRFEER